MATIVNWMEWSDSMLTMHENTIGKAADTQLGLVRYEMIDNEFKWAAYDRNNVRVAACDTREAAQQALMHICDAQEITVY